jgi:hypothetical protein
VDLKKRNLDGRAQIHSHTWPLAVLTSHKPCKIHEPANHEYPHATHIERPNLELALTAAQVLGDQVWDATW